METLPRPPAHVRLDRTLREVCYPTAELDHPIAQVNYIVVSEFGQECPAHVHENLTETFVCLEGSMVLHLDGPFGKASEVLTPGRIITVEPGTYHRVWANAGARYLELRSTLYRDELFNPDKQFLESTGAARIAVLNQEAYERL